MYFSNKLKLIRTTNKLTQEQFAESIGVSRSNIANLELGNVKPTKLLINCIALTYNIDKEWLINNNYDGSDGIKKSTKTPIPDLLIEKYIQLDKKYQEFVLSQILELLRLQSI
ncbi:helix-turn-helix transcriptional regulator [Clostridium ihumii]|uniref:helix-turn-helix transcriptional regulator n=1 Tax=Clostridium ihumii TaxID=1470356 RepID=UPI000688BC27|nr:helix-turn-helix transcriptional regulator [Clostridium ihumii]